jgi:hypothetical protein
MSIASESPHFPWRLIHLFNEQLNKIRIRNAFADARRAQLARLSAQQIGPPFEPCFNRTRPRDDRDAVIAADRCFAADGGHGGSVGFSALK